MNEVPYRDGPLKQESHPSMRINDEEEARAKTSGARAFDTLVTSNLQLVKTLRAAILVMAVCGLLATAMTVLSAVTLRMGQAETRELIVALNRKDCR